jgi:hypothetical protein
VDEASCLGAHRARTIRMCSLDARNEGRDASPHRERGIRERFHTRASRTRRRCSMNARSRRASRMPLPGWGEEEHCDEPSVTMWVREASDLGARRVRYFTQPTPQTRQDASLPEQNVLTRCAQWRPEALPIPGERGRFTLAPRTRRCSMNRAVGGHPERSAKKQRQA